ncbi:hypothetical protein ACP70R_016681 [Stipagrostis hirtigluma subsp. patula]
METKENAAASAPPQPLKGPRGKRKALAELPTAGPNTNGGEAPRASKPKTRSAARAESEAEEARKRREADDDPARMADVSRLPEPRKPDAGAAQAAVAPYLDDIDQYLRALEVEQLRRPNVDNFWKIQKDINPKMRAILVDWLVDVVEEFKLQAETLYLAVSYVDRFLTMDVITRDKLQLLGVTALLVAAKYEEIETYKMKVNKYTDITDGTYTKQQVVKMEAELLKTLNFQMGGPTVRTFVRRFITCCRGNRASAEKLEAMCTYLAELSLLDYECVRYLPSVVAAACLFVARFTINPKTRPWNLTLQQKTGYKVVDLREPILALDKLQLGIRLPDQKAIREKYEDPKFGCVSTMASPREIPASFLEDLNK